jgi:hypothetical protein
MTEKPNQGSAIAPSPTARGWVDRRQMRTAVYEFDAAVRSGNGDGGFGKRLEAGNDAPAGHLIAQWLFD